MNEKLILEFAKLVKEEGGQAYYVGGYVRDFILGRKPKDIDIEVHKITEEKLKKILEKLGKTLEYGKEFGVFSLKDTNIEISLPRKEVKTGDRHNSFDVEIDPNMSFADACRRRDFTINAMMINILTNEFIDPFHGKDDLIHKTLIHINDNTFVEDPLRVFRAAQLASRYGLTIDNSTIELCKKMDVNKLSKERVEAELKKALTQSERPSIFFNSLTKMDQLDYWFKEVKACIGYEQNPKNHPEGDLYNHIMMVLDDGVTYREMSSNPYNFMLLLLVHDFGKLKTKVFTDDGIHFFGHENSLDDIKSFLDRIGSSNDTKNYIFEMVPRHMKGHKIYKNNLSEYESNLWFSSVKYPKDLVYLTTSDKSNHQNAIRFTYFWHRYNIFEDIISRGRISGNDLISNHIEPNENFHEYLRYANDLILHGISKENALRKTLEYINNK